MQRQIKMENLHRAVECQSNNPIPYLIKAFEGQEISFGAKIDAKIARADGRWSQPCGIINGVRVFIIENIIKY